MSRQDMGRYLIDLGMYALGLSFFFTALIARHHVPWMMLMLIPAAPLMAPFGLRMFGGHKPRVNEALEDRVEEKLCR